MDPEYSEKVRKELSFYEDVESVHSLPESQHYVNESYLRPLLTRHFGYGGFVEMVQQFVTRIQGWVGDRTLKVLSVGSGNCDFEIGLIADHGMNLKVHCLELNQKMLERAAESAHEKGVSRRLRLVHCDINELELNETYDLVIGNYALHHFVELERIFERIHEAMEGHSIFLINEMIGRNGHMFWEPTMDLVNRLWSLLPRAQKHDHLLQRDLPLREQWDCSTESFEGVRAQDILPLLDRYFHFVDFAPFYAILNRFTDRDFGPNFDPANPLDRALLDFVWQLDDMICSRHLLKPTQMQAAVARKDQTGHPRRWIYFEHPAELYGLDDSRFYEVFDAFDLSPARNSAPGSP